MKAVPIVGHQKRARKRWQHNADLVSGRLNRSDGVLDLVGNDAVHETSSVAHRSSVEAEPWATRRKGAALERMEKHRIALACEAVRKERFVEEADDTPAVGGCVEPFENTVARGDTPSSVLGSTRIGALEVGKREYRALHVSRKVVVPADRLGAIKRCKVGRLHSGTSLQGATLANDTGKGVHGAQIAGEHRDGTSQQFVQGKGGNVGVAIGSDGIDNLVANGGRRHLAPVFFLSTTQLSCRSSGAESNDKLSTRASSRACEANHKRCHPPVLRPRSKANPASHLAGDRKKPMKKPYGDYVAGPQEARPLSWTELATSERDLLTDIHARLNEICKAAVVQRTPRSLDPWAEMEHDPRGRVMAITGARGSGKTTLLVTLLDQLRRARNLDFSDPITDGPAVGVRPLPILDFDPLPDGLPLHAWLVQAWLPLVEHLEAHALGARVSPPHPNDPFEAATLREAWDRLFERAVIGWTDVHDGRSMVDRLFDHRDQLRDYQTLASDWKQFVDEVFARLEQSGDRGAAAILVPIDDLDLQVRRNVELIHAIRLLRHPRVIYLITGDLAHTLEVLFFDYRRQHLQLASVGAFHVSEASQQELDIMCRAPAEALLEKAFPVPYRFGTSPVSLKMLVDLRDGQLKAALNSLSAGGRPLGDWLSDRCSGPIGSNENYLQWRSAQRILERLNQFTDAKEQAKYILHDILAQKDATDSVRVADPGHGAVIDYGLAGELSMTVRPGWFTGPPNRRITVGTELVAHLSAPDGRPLDAPSAVLARELHEVTEDPQTGLSRTGTGLRGPVQADRIIVNIATVLAWTRWTNGPRNAIFLWPFARYPRIPTLRSWLRDWDEITNQIRDAKDPAERLAYAWIHCQLVWGQMSVPSTPIWAGALEENHWVSLLQAAADASRTDDFKYWYGASLPLFATPEFGLPVKVQRTILTALATSDEPSRQLVLRLDPPRTDAAAGERHQCVVDALYAAWKEGGSRGTEPTDTDADALLTEARKLYPDAPWYQVRDVVPTRQMPSTT